MRSIGGITLDPNGYARRTGRARPINRPHGAHLEFDMLGKLVSIASLATLAAVGVAANTVTQDTKPAAAAAPANGVTVYGVDGVHSCAMFRVQHAGAGQFWGRFNVVEGTFTMSDDPMRMAFAIDIPVESIDTRTEKLDGHLKSPDFFNAAEFPKMSFKSTGVKKGANGMFEVAGDFTMHGVTKPVTAMVEVTGVSEMMGGRAGAEATFTVKRSDFGMSYGVEKGVLGDMVKVVVNLEGVKAK